VPDPQPLVIAFDGECLMCSRGIRWLAEHDHHDRLRFVRLQSPRGRAMEDRAGTGSLATALVESDGRVHARSDALLRVFRALGGPFALLAALGRLVPRRLRDAAYDFIAARRHRWFGRGDACALLSEALHRRLLD
jgi:predicted DCC family thiol-disulfide oxidoreductase YuxK